MASNPTTHPTLILYSKPGCHLCEGLQEKIEQIQSFPFRLEIRDITSRDDWFQAYQYDIPVLLIQVGDRTHPMPRIAPRSSVQQVEQLLQKHLFEIL
jgi:Glutaredoxin-like domain (DUF836)